MGPLPTGIHPTGSRRVNGSQDTAFNARYRLILAALEDARRESSREEWETLLTLLEQRVLWLRHRDRLAA